MSFVDSHRDTIPVELPNGTIVKVEVTTTGREDVGFDVKPFKGITEAIEGVAEAVNTSLQKVSPDKASIKFGLEIQVDQGGLVAAIVQGTGKANLEITLEWAAKH